ncbi:MAG: hypothetical protein ABI740_06005, partial [Alphaproteobacteria bacterium]
SLQHTRSYERFPTYRNMKLTLMEWAELTNTPEGTLRRRKSQGFTDNEILEGRRSKVVKKIRELSFEELVDYQPWAEEKRVRYERLFQKHREPDEDRFHFLVHRIIPAQFDKLREDETETAYYLKDDDELDEFIHSSGKTEYNCWGKRSAASRKDWERLVQAYKAWLKVRSRAKSDYREWLAAIELAPQYDAGAAQRIQRELRVKYGGMKKKAAGDERAKQKDDGDWAVRDAGD